MTVVTPFDDDDLIFYAVYRSPSDYPGEWVVRRIRATQDGVERENTVWETARSVDGARASIPQGLFRIKRDETDAEGIYETWF